jgi:hypothetical protein
LTEEGKSGVASTDTTSITQAYADGIIGRGQALSELRQLSRKTGMWSTITAEDVNAAMEEPPPGIMGMPGMEGGEGQLGQFGVQGSEERMAQPGEQQLGLRPQEPRAPEEGGGRRRPPLHVPKARLHLHLGDRMRKWFGRQSVDQGARSTGAVIDFRSARDEASRNIEFQGLPIYIEARCGELRHGKKLAADYGFFRQTGSAEGAAEGMDCFVGPDALARYVWLVDHLTSKGTFEEEKALLGFPSCAAGLAAYNSAYDRRDIGGAQRMTMPEFKKWLIKQGYQAPQTTVA